MFIVTISHLDILHMETLRNEIVDVLKKLTRDEKKEWLTWLTMELQAELGLRKRGEIMKDD